MKASTATWTGFGLWLLAVAVPVALKLLHLTRVSAWPWWKVWLPLWVPWGVLTVLSLAGLLLHAISRRRG